MTPTPSPDTVEPTEAERALICAIKQPSWVADERRYAALIRQHVAAEVSRELAGLEQTCQSLRWSRNNLQYIVGAVAASTNRNQSEESVLLAVQRVVAERDAMRSTLQKIYDMPKQYNFAGRMQNLAWQVLTAHKSSPPPPAS